MTFKRYKEGSRADWGAEIPDGQILTRDQIELGAILRIADASEFMARNHDQLIRERDRAREDARNAWNRVEALRRSNAALRGHLNRKRRSKAGGEG